MSKAKGVLSADGQRIDKVIEEDGAVSRTSVVEQAPREPTLAEQYAAAAAKMGELVRRIKQSRDAEAAHRAAAQRFENDLAEHTTLVNDLHAKVLGEARL